MSDAGTELIGRWADRLCRHYHGWKVDGEHACHDCLLIADDLYQMLNAPTFDEDGNEYPQVLR